MSLNVDAIWDRSAAAGDGEHWLAVTIRGVQGGDEPRALAILVDTSTSMVGARLDRARAAVGAVVRSFGHADRVHVIGFGSTLTSLGEVAGGTDLTDVLPRLVGAGKTRLDLAMDAGERWLRDQSGRRLLLLLTDGDPTDADGRRVDTESFVERARVLGAAGIRMVVVGLGSADGYDASFLRALADAAGGVACVGVRPDMLAEQTRAALDGGSADSSDFQVVLDSAEVSLVEAWRVEPRVQPIPVRDGAVVMPLGDGGTILLRCKLVLGLGARRGERRVGNLVVSPRGVVGITVPLSLTLVPPGSAERAVLDAEVDRLRVKVELARTAQMRAATDEWADQLRLTQQLAGLAEQLGDPRATIRVQTDLSKLLTGTVLGKDERQLAVDALRGGSDDG